MPIRPLPSPAFLFTSPAAAPAVLLVLLISTVLCPPVLAGEIEATSRIVQATVYPNRATLIREAVVDVPAGASVAVLRGLPANLLTDSLRAEGHSQARVRFSALTHRQESQAELIVPRERELNQRIEELQDRRDQVQALRTALAVQRAFLENIGTQAEQRVAEDVSNLRLNAEAWGQAADALGQGLAEILKADLAHEITMRGMDRTLQALKTELSSLHTGLRDAVAVRLPLEADAATRLTIRLQYQVPGVSWRPVYDARLDTADGELSLVQYGAVRQNTGEDWKDVELVLSTARPQRGADLPDLTPLWVDLRTPAKLVQREQLGADMAMKSQAPNVLYSADMAGQGLDGQEAEITSAHIRTAGFVTQYVIPGRVSVPADGTQTRLLCGTFATDNKLLTQIKPQLSTEAFLVSRATLLGDAPLLPGPASLFRDGAYIGQVQLPLLRPGQAKDIGFGIDDRIAVTRNTLKDEHGDPTLLSRSRQLQRQVATIIANQGRQDVEIVVLETVPAPRHDKISLEIASAETTPGYEQDVDDTPGLLRWTATLAPNEETRITLGWKLSWPGDQELSGL